MAADVTTYTVTQWLQGKTAVTISDETIQSICFERDIATDELAVNLGQKDRDLVLADLYLFLATLPTSTATIDDKNGNWEHKEGSVTISNTDRKAYRLMAYRLYRKWNIVPPASLSSVRFSVMGMRNRRQYGK